MKTQSKPKYIAGIEHTIYEYFNNHQDSKFGEVADMFGISMEEAHKLSLLWNAGPTAKDSFNTAVFEIFEGSPT